MRKTYILIEHNGERALVKSLNGHDGCKVIRERVPEPPSDHCRLCPKGTWNEDAEAKEQARIERMNKSEIADEIVRRMQTANLNGDGKV
jgi:hypothetical protein